MKTDLIDIGADTPGQANVLRVLRFEGSGSGPKVYIQAGLHAQEFPGFVAIDQLIPKLLAAELQGQLASNIIVVPHAKPIGLGQALYSVNLGRFDMNSRTNFNRSFPKPQQPPSAFAAKSVVENLKATLLDLAIQADIVLDLHCDDEGPVYLYAPVHMVEKARLLSAALQAKVILTYASQGASTFDEAVCASWRDGEDGLTRQKFVSTVELRGMLDVSREFGEKDATSLFAYLISIGAISGQTPTFEANEPVVGDESLAELIPTPHAGAVLYHVEVSEPVKAGQWVASIITEAGMPHHKILAPADGIVVTRRERRFLRKGEDVIKILKVAAPPRTRPLAPNEPDPQYGDGTEA